MRRSRMVPIEWEGREYRMASAVSMAHGFGRIPGADDGLRRGGCLFEAFDPLGVIRPVYIGTGLSGSEGYGLADRVAMAARTLETMAVAVDMRLLWN